MKRPLDSSTGRARRLPLALGVAGVALIALLSFGLVALMAPELTAGAAPAVAVPQAPAVQPTATPQATTSSAPSLQQTPTPAPPRQPARSAAGAAVAGNTAAGNSTQANTSTGEAGAAQARPATTDASIALLGSERINILILGIDQRPSERGQPTRSDTMILLSVDPVARTAAMLSIPRDLWVNIPYSKPFSERINTANFYGDLYKVSGGGPALAKQAVSELLGVPVTNYIRINFDGVKQIVDTLGGVDINVAEAIRDDTFPADDGDGYISVYFPAGMQHMDGATALRYIRTRHADSDFGRMQRQQQFLLALRAKASQLSTLPKLPLLLAQLRGSIDTDLSLIQIIGLAHLAVSMDSSQIQNNVIDQAMAVPWVTPEGGDVLLPDHVAIRRLVDTMLAANKETSRQNDRPPM